jgi:hypothetical protein
MHIPELNKPPQTQCPCDNGSCSIYEQRPQSCRDYNCLWLRGDLFRVKKKKNKQTSIEPLRPDKLGVIFDNASEDGSIVAREVNEGALEDQSGLIMQVAAKVGRIVLLYRDGRKGII